MGPPPVREELVQTHTTSLREALDTLLSGCTKSNDIKSDANILNVKEYTELVLSQYETVWTEVSNDLANTPDNDTLRDINYAISVNDEKYARVKNFEKAVSEREQKLMNLYSKIKTLRSTVPSEIEANHN